MNFKLPRINILLSKVLLLVFIIFIASTMLYSQHTISGKVTDENNQPIVYANVYLKHSNFGSITNIEGNFSVSIPNKTSSDTLIISSIGYIETQIALNKATSKNQIVLKKQIKVYEEVAVTGKQTNPNGLLIKAFENTKANFPDSSYNAKLFSRQFIKYDTAFVFYRKTLAEIESRNDNIWFNGGNILADQIINSGKLPYESNALGGNLYFVLTPAIDFPRFTNNQPNLKKYESKIDTVYYAGNDLIYVVDIWAKKMKYGTYTLSQKILDEIPQPYSMIFYPGVEKLGTKMSEDNSFLVRYHINTSKENTVVRKTEMFVSTGAKKTFNYIISDFNNEAGNSYPTHVVSFVMEINKETNGARGNIISLNEIFCYDYQNPASKKFSPENSLHKQYVHPVFEVFKEDLQDYNTWKEQTSYILTDSLQEKAIRQLKLLKQFPNDIIPSGINKAKQKRFTNSRTLPQMGITGTVCDSISEKPLEFCNIQFKTLNSEYKTSGCITDENGIFHLSIELGEKYIREVSMVGYNTFTDTIDFKVENPEEEMSVIAELNLSIPDLDMGMIKLKPSIDMLNEVEVSESATSIDLNKETVIVTKDLIQNTIATKDILNKLDGLQYNYVNGDLKVDNDKNVKIVVDGVEKDREYILNLNPKRIRKVEILRDISGYYGMQGYSSLINIITHSNYRGTDALLSGQYMDKINNRNTTFITQKSANLNLDVTRDDWSFYFEANASGFESALFTSTQTKYSNIDMQIINEFDSLPSHHTHSSNYNLSLGSDYRINKKHLVGGELSIKGFPSSSANQIRSKDQIISATDTINNNTLINSISDYFKYSGNLYYNLKFNEKSRLITYFANTYNTANYNQTVNKSEILEYKKEYSNLKLDANYTNTIKEEFTFSTGVSYLENYSVSKGKLTDFSNFYSKLQAFSDFELQFTKKYSLSLGTSFDRYYQKNNETNVLFNSFQPHVSLKTKLNDKNKLSVNYKLSTEFPYLDDLIPQAYYLSSFQIFKGNPSLKPYQFHKLSTEYRHYTKGFLSYLSIKPYYHYSGNLSGYISNINESVIEYTKDNFVKYEKIGLNSSLAFQFTKKISASLEFDLFREQNTNLETRKFIDWTGFTQVNYDISPSWHSGLLYQKDRYYTVNSLGYSQVGMNYFMVYLLTMQFKGRLQVYAAYSLPWYGDTINESYEQTPFYEKTTFSKESFMSNMFFITISFRLSNGKVNTSDINIQEELPVDRDNKTFRIP